MERIKNEDDFFKIMIHAIESELPFVVYRKPNANSVQGIFQKTDRLYHTENYQESGFVFAPFDSKDPSILFPASESSSYSYESSNTHMETEINSNNSFVTEKKSKSEHIQLVNKGIQFLEKNEFKKVVLSRKEEVNIKELDVQEIFKKLLSNYSNAFAYCWYHPRVGLWLGATPETLVKVKENIFVTMALAGTQVFDNTTETKWNAKEILEQQYVTDFILEQLKSDVEVSEPYTVKAGNLVHLRTDISGKLTAALTLNKIIDLLHPTPAVCGVPKEEAKDFILESEYYNRRFYTGFLGELNTDKSSNLYVNLRCMQILKNHIEIYIGGGITRDSNPESEWEETVAKARVIKKVL